jgi:hypothetical protein
MIIGVVIQSLVLGYVTFKTDWNEQVNPNDYNMRISSIVSSDLYNRNVI